MRAMKKSITLLERKGTKVIATIFSMLFVILLAQFSSIVSAEKEGSSVNKQLSNKPGVDNIGFIKNPPKKLTERFQVCDAFLNVEWIDKEKMIGYTTYEAIMKGKAAKYGGERKRVWAMVDMKVPGFDYDVYQYRRKGKLDEVFEMVRNGAVNTRIPMTIKYKGKTISLYPGKAVNDDAIHPLLSDHYLTVCIAYPDEQRVWIVEGKSVRQFYSEEQGDDLYRHVNAETGGGFPRKRFDMLWILDVNNDGVEDLFYGQSFIYSVGDKFYRMKRIILNDDYKFVFPPSGNSCKLVTSIVYPLITDGNNYYLNNQCNLTKLTSPIGRE